MKNTNHYRKCPNCPHTRNRPQCCCQRSASTTRVLTSRPKKQPSTIDNSVINTTLPTISAAEVTALRKQNTHLRHELLNVSAFLKQDVHSTVSMFHSESGLSQKLFIANKNLKESQIQIDNLSKINKELYERNTQLIQHSEGMKIQLREQQSYLERYKKKCRKYNQECLDPNKANVERLVKENYELQKEIQFMKEQLRCLRFENKNFSMIGNLSPEWVAHTNNKYNNEKTHLRESELEIEMFKRSLSQTINVLKNAGNHFISTSYDNVGNIRLVDIGELIKNLLETYSESIFGHFTLLIKEINRKLNTYDKKLSNLTSKLQNFLIIIRNKKLKKKVHPNISFIKTDRMPLSEVTNRML